MKTSQRFNNSVQKLYKAFHNNRLNPECAKQCAVGNILDNNDSWKHLSDNHGSLQLNYVGFVNQKFGKRFGGYSPLELLKIESEFLKGCGYSLPLHHKGKRPNNLENKDILFEGLCSVVACLSNLEGIENPMDYSSLFDYNIQEPEPII